MLKYEYSQNEIQESSEALVNLLWSNLSFIRSIEMTRFIQMTNTSQTYE